MINLLIRIVINGIAIVLTSYVVNGIRADQNISTVLILGLLFGVINGLVRPIVKFFSFPVIILTLGLFILVINALMLMLVGNLSGGRLVVDGFVPALIGAIVMSVINMILEAVAGVNRKSDE